MLNKYQNSLLGLLFLQEATLLLLLLMTGLLGVAFAYFWQQSSEESMRLADLIYTTEQIRSELFGQVQTAIRAKLLKDIQYLALYNNYSRRIDKKFNKLHSSAISQQEYIAIQHLHISYREIQKDMNAIFTNPDDTSVTQMRILDPRFSGYMIGRFEGQAGKLKQLLTKQHNKLNHQLDIWSRYSPIVISILLLLAFFLIIYVRTIFRKKFLQPVSEIITKARLISTGQLETNVPEQGVEETKNLAAAINKMSRDLQDSQATLVENEKQIALVTLIPVVAHNIRNPLSSIRATAQVLDVNHSKQEIEESRQAIMDTTDRLSRWVNALVSYLHPLKPNYRLVYASTMLEAVIDLSVPKAADKQISIVKSGWQHDVRLNADPDLMEQAIYSLMVNAVEASPQGGTLTIGLQRVDNTLIIFITDQGDGLPFEPQPAQLAPGPSTKNFGTGLGLPIAFKICQKHGWKLSFDSQPSEGTTAKIVAPIRVIEE